MDTGTYPPSVAVGHRPVYWCPTCPAIIYDVVAASAHEFAHPALRQIGTLPVYAPAYSLPYA